MLPAIVTDVQYRAAVAGVRALGRSGVAVNAVAPYRLAAGLWSRYARTRRVSEDSIAHPGRFIAALEETAREHGASVVYPGREDSVATLTSATLSSGLVLPYPGPSEVDALRDKRRLPEMATSAGLAVAREFAEGTPEDLRRIEMSLPCIVKSVTSLAPKVSTVVWSRAQYLDLLATVPPDHRLLVQERIPGPLRAVTVVIDRGGRLVGRFQQEARRTWPAGAGPSSLAVSVAPDEVLVGRVAEMLRSVGYWGLAEVQLVRTASGDAPIDINPRFYGSMPLALASGVNLPFLWHAVVCGSQLPAPGPYRVGVTYRVLKSDLSAALQGRPRRLFSRADRPATGAMWASDDPIASGLLAVSSVTTKLSHRRR